MSVITLYHIFSEQSILKKENLYQDIADAVGTLLNMARDASFNTISDNCSFILSEIKYSEGGSTAWRWLCKAEKKRKKTMPLADIIPQLEALYPNLYDVNLLIYKAYKNATVIVIQYYPLSALDINYQQLVATQTPMLHCKVPIPAYASETHEKFDINWEHGSFLHRWKMFWWHRKMAKASKQHLSNQ